MRHFALSAIGRDRPGIVASVTRELLGHSVNIEDSQMGILRGHFTMTLVLAAPDEVDAAELRGALERTGRELGLEAVSLSEVGDESSHRDEPSHIVSVYGVDHPGIVHAAAEALAALAVNITDLETRLVEAEGAEPLYVMMLEVALPEGLSAAALDASLEAIRREQGVEVSVRELERDAL